MSSINDHPCVFAVGILGVVTILVTLSPYWCILHQGNIVSFMVYLAPLPTFNQIYKKKSTEGFQSVPYVISLFSAMLYIYYAMLNSNDTILISINSIGCFIETIYIGFYIFYAPKKAKMQTAGMLVLLNIVGFGLILLLTFFLAKGSRRAHIVGWICMLFSLSVFVAPLCIVKQVIRTKNVEYMPFLLSFFLTLSAVVWFLYGVLKKDYYIAIPNVLGFTFGVLQMVLYLMYKNSKKVIEKKQQLPELIQNQIIPLEGNKLPELKEADQIIDVMKLSRKVMCSEIIPQQNNNGDEVVGLENVPN